MDLVEFNNFLKIYFLFNYTTIQIDMHKKVIEYNFRKKLL